ncbi:MAG: class I SAM-dependent methyltransferase [Chthoniobacterales bacterium]
MRLFHKLKKLGDPRLLQSMRKHAGRAILKRRLVFRVDADRIISSIDRQGFRAIHDRHAVENPGQEWPKYLDLKKWVRTNLLRVGALHLDYGRRRRVLDIGSGAGYFLYICKWFGHDPVALDIDEVPMYPEMTRLLGLKRIIWRVEAFQPLPDLGARFDLITAFMICFNGHKSDALWGPREWDFFLIDLRCRLKPRGRIWLEFNREFDGEFMNEELREFFRSRGAETSEQKVIFLRPPLLGASTR